MQSEHQWQNILRRAKGADGDVAGKNKMKSGVHAETRSAPLAKLLHQLNAIELAAAEFPLALSTTAAAVDPWEWMHANAGLSRIAWFDRSSKITTVGIGTAAEVSVPAGGAIPKSVSDCRDLLRHNAELKFFGGVSFDGDSAWPSFGAGRFVVPRLQLCGDTLTLAVMDAEDVQQARLDLARICMDEVSFDSRLPLPLGRSDAPPIDGWQSRVDEALSLIRSEVIEKIVLSRKTVLDFSEPLNPIALTARLKESTNDCFVFCFDFGENASFVGATPERLFFRHQDQLESEVVAGTRTRGATPEEDERLAIELLTSDKDQREHDIVRKSIRQKLHKYIDHLRVDTQASILRLARKQHLRSNVRGTLKPDVDDGVLLERLHPTPAVGGYPTDNALPEIARIEPYNRGWYAAPVGWIGADSAHFAVAIRSGLIEANTLSLFSGAGIVRGSEPEQEWQEVENKIQDFISVLGK